MILKSLLDSYIMLDGRLLHLTHNAGDLLSDEDPGKKSKGAKKDAVLISLESFEIPTV